VASRCGWSTRADTPHWSTTEAMSRSHQHGLDVHALSRPRARTVSVPLVSFDGKPTPPPSSSSNVRIPVRPALSAGPGGARRWPCAGQVSACDRRG
jgi:hypothetical protein